MKKLLALVSTVGLVAMMNGCGLNDPVSAPTISIDNIGSIAIAASNVSKTVTGKIEADTAISSISAEVTTSSGSSVPSTQIEVTTPAANGATSQNLTSTSGIVLVIKPAAQAGDYKLKITVTAGVEGSGSFNFTLTGGGTVSDITVDSLLIGSYDNDQFGSSMELDNGDVLMASEAIVAGSGVDLVGTYSASKGGFRFFNPAYAKSSSNITVFANWASPANTDFVEVPSSTSFESLDTKAKIQAAYDGGTKITEVTCQAGAVLAVKTTEGNYVLVKLCDFDDDATGIALVARGK
jgi:hypothetical protein